MKIDWETGQVDLERNETISHFDCYIPPRTVFYETENADKEEEKCND